MTPEISTGREVVGGIPKKLKQQLLDVLKAIYADECLAQGLVKFKKRKKKLNTLEAWAHKKPMAISSILREGAGSSGTSGDSSRRMHLLKRVRSGVEEDPN